MIRTLREVERVYIEHALKCFSGNKTQAAKALGISLRGLRVKLHDLKLEKWIEPAAVQPRSNNKKQTYWGTE